MKCPKCGNDVKENVCPNCGHNMNGINHNNEIKTNKSQNNFLLIIMFSSVIIFFFILGLSFKTIKDYEIKDYIKYAEDEIPTVYKIIGKKNIVNIIKIKTKEIISYKTSDFTNDDLYNYVQSLYDINFVDLEAADGFKLIKESKEKGKIIIISITTDRSQIDFVYDIVEGSLSDYEISGTIDIGNSTLGYLKIPGNFEKISEEKNNIEYTNSNYKNESIKLSYVKEPVSIETYSTSLLAELKGKGAQATLNETQIYGNEGFIINSKYEDKYTETWVFKDQTDKLFTIDIKSPNKRSDIFETISSYRLDAVEK